MLSGIVSPKTVFFWVLKHRFSLERNLKCEEISTRAKVISFLNSSVVTVVTVATVATAMIVVTDGGDSGNMVTVVAIVTMLTVVAAT
jgi:hypothetical protein